MEYFSACPLTTTGTFTLFEGEFELLKIDRVTLLNHDKKATPYTRGLLTVTTHRLVWVDAGRRQAVAAWLAYLPEQRPVEDKSSPFTARVLLRFGQGVRVELEGSSASKDRDRLLTQVKIGVQRREWEVFARAKAEEEARKAKMTEYVPRRIGVTGIQDRVQQHSQEQRKAIESGFESLEDLRRQAADLVKIADAFRSATTTEADDELVSMMADMGIESPVTRQSTGGNVNLYREQLARQVATFLHQRILNVGGILTISDAYCLVMRNRATTELVSPEDFRAACDFFTSLRLPIQVTRLESGADALQVDSTLDDSGARGLLKMAEERTSVTAIDVTRVRNIPIQRARAMLEDAESSGFLARDETTDGLRFFPNVFPSFTIRIPQAPNKG